MNKYFEEWDGKKFSVREVMLPEELGGFAVKVTDVELYHEYESEYERGDSKAVELDNSIYYFCDSGFIASDPTDKEIIEYLIKHEC
jgi:hypothetical protein